MLLTHVSGQLLGPFLCNARFYDAIFYEFISFPPSTWIKDHYGFSATTSVWLDAIFVPSRNILLIKPIYSIIESFLFSHQSSKNITVCFQPNQFVRKSTWEAGLKFERYIFSFCYKVFFILKQYEKENEYTLELWSNNDMEQMEPKTKQHTFKRHQ